MHRRRLNLCALWLLPLVIARLCVPDGFMVSMTGAGIDLALCPATAALPLPSGMDTRGPHHPDMDDSPRASHPAEGGVPHQGQAASPCAFALAGTATSNTTAATVYEFGHHPEQVSALEAGPTWTAPPARIDRIRGPPLA